MKWSAFSRAIEDFRAPWVREKYRDEAETFARAIEIGQRFYVPSDNDLIGGKQHHDYIDLYRLPFGCTVILWQANFAGFDKPVQTMTVAIEIGSDEERELGITNSDAFAGCWISITTLVFEPWSQRWSIGATAGVKKVENADGKIGLQLYASDDACTSSILEESGRDAVWNRMQIEVAVVTNLCVMLGMKNVRSEIIKAPSAVNNKRLRNGKSTLLDYHVLSVDGEVWNSDDASGAGAPGAGTRSHLRRGHIRRISEGRRVWVRAAFVHGRVDGFVSKDYEVAR